MFVPVESPPEPPAKVINHDYDQVVKWLDRHLANDFATTVEERKWWGNEKVLFEDGSWNHKQYTGCLMGWPCDTDDEFNLGDARCFGSYVGINHVLFDHPLQFEFDCYTDRGFSNVTLHLSGESEDLGQHEFMIRINHDEQRIYLPIMFGHGETQFR